MFTNQTKKMVIKKMNFNPMDLIHIKEKYANRFDVEEVSKFINLLINLQCDGINDEDLKSKLGEYFFAKQEFLEAGARFGMKSMHLFIIKHEK